MDLRISDHCIEQSKITPIRSGGFRSIPGWVCRHPDFSELVHKYYIAESQGITSCWQLHRAAKTAALSAAAEIKRTCTFSDSFSIEQKQYYTILATKALFSSDQALFGKCCCKYPIIKDLCQLNNYDVDMRSLKDHYNELCMTSAEEKAEHRNAAQSIDKTCFKKTSRKC